MLFNSNFFLYIFLPSLLILYLVVPATVNMLRRRGNAIISTGTYHNILLLLYSLLFYLLTSGKQIWVLLVIVLGDYLFALSLKSFQDRSGLRKLILILGILFNLGFLIYFKYMGFLVDNLSKIFRKAFQTEAIITFNAVLPVGISFFVFQSLSYVIDVYLCKVEAQRNPFSVLLYVSLFPQLVAGPIVRYETVNKEINSRTVTFDDIYYGTKRFIRGISKKVLLADLYGGVVDQIFSLEFSRLTTPLAWIGAFLYMLQIYFDFSAYSDMAIGIGRILGFHFLENFLLPYSSENITVFWRRWHISLSTFLRDYLYIPLGGNRRGTLRTYINLVIVFLVCGLWHGASWSFVFWGAYHGFFMLLERVLKGKFGYQMRGITGRIITFFIVMIGWIFFRADSISFALSFIKVMFGGENLSGFQYYPFLYFVNVKLILFSILGLILSAFPISKYIENAGHNISDILTVVILVLTMAFMSDASFTPFIYFKF